MLRRGARLTGFAGARKNVREGFMRLSFFRQLAVSLALAAMLLRALLPDGWMPNTRADAAASPFVICSLGGAHHSDRQPADRDRQHGPCAFAAAGHLAPPVDVAFAIGPSGSAGMLASRLENEAFPTYPQFRPNRARAPPAFT
jgi:hypothetical protein